MSFSLVLLAAGNSSRFKSNLAKPYHKIGGKTLIEICIKKAIKFKQIKKIILVHNKKDLYQIKNLKLKNIKLIKGGTTRQGSTFNALRYLKKTSNISKVLIHDAARPNFSINLLKSLVNSLKNNKATVPFIKSKDSIKYKIKDQLFNLDRDKSFFTQTPQAYKFKELYNLSIKEKNKTQDEATLFIKNDLKIRFIKGENLNNKITYREDIKETKTNYGIGFDIHRLIIGKKLFLGGVKVPFHSGLKGHSDGDVILHAIIDALLGAIKKKDIGTFFPDTKNKFKNIRSPNMLKPVLEILNKNNFFINNIDINLICEKPKVSKYRSKIIESLSNLLSIHKDLINLKGKTVEKLGLIGKEEAIACEVIASINKYDQ